MVVVLQFVVVFDFACEFMWKLPVWIFLPFLGRQQINLSWKIDWCWQFSHTHNLAPQTKWKLTFLCSLSVFQKWFLHGNCAAVRSGDYYLFEDLDEKVELDLLHERPSAGIEDAITDRKLGDKLTVEQVKTLVTKYLFFLSNIHQIIRSSLKFHQKGIILFVVKYLKEKEVISNRSTKFRISAREMKNTHNLFCFVYRALASFL